MGLLAIGNINRQPLSKLTSNYRQHLLPFNVTNKSYPVVEAMDPIRALRSSSHPRKPHGVQGYPDNLLWALISYKPSSYYFWFHAKFVNKCKIHGLCNHGLWFHNANPVNCVLVSDVRMYAWKNRIALWCHNIFYHFFHAFKSNCSVFQVLTITRNIFH